MPKATPATVPDDADLAQLREAARSCTACDLAGPATQTVFGEGAPHARVVLVGEQPGDQEDRSGRPFVGPAGRLLDDALVDAGIDREQVWITNAVKHFRFESTRGGKLRLHRTPTVTQVRICAPWLQAELGRIRPELLVALGATAAKALRGQDFRITASRGQLLDGDGYRFLATAHPSAVLRADDRDEAYRMLVDDLTVAARAL
ncbi:UdgX family uracil-DNA binding protein [Jatrophihabitans endophyticus]|uniref:UdgX family uracil-DNA binding protein n=1 Tax=Jatrophihabitans endophyticus TaxID=1206085 RepID=UPI001A00412F|nr:UdgX family uracil-DNA binding protein [Jatrophihabitans endophyticus]MBE7187822.1 UdgX family uracil-DNA binding protein [Jatrophihabitans endophyticus]